MVAQVSSIRNGWKWAAGIIVNTLSVHDRRARESSSLPFSLVSKASESVEIFPRDMIMEGWVIRILAWEPEIYWIYPNGFLGARDRYIFGLSYPFWAGEFQGSAKFVREGCRSGLIYSMPLQAWGATSVWVAVRRPPRWNLMESPHFTEEYFALPALMSRIRSLILLDSFAWFLKCRWAFRPLTKEGKSLCWENSLGFNDALGSFIV